MPGLLSPPFLYAPVIPCLRQRLTLSVQLEVVIAAKWSKGQFSEPAPMWAKVFWSLFAVGLAAYPVVKFGLQSRRKRKQR